MRRTERHPHGEFEPPPIRTIRISIWGTAGLVPDATGFFTLDDEGKTRVDGVNVGGRLVFKTSAAHHGAWLTYGAPGYEGRNERIILDAEDIEVPALQPLGTPARKGTVRASGRCFVDDSGQFFPLGATLFWAIRGWKYEPDRVRQQFAFLRKHRWDFFRVLGDVGWSGLETNSNWPDYQALVADMVDVAYDEYGLRTQLTVWGGGDRDPMRATDQLIEVIKGREPKFLYLEGVNERNLKSLDTLTAITKKLQATGLLTAPGYGDDYGGVMLELLAKAGNLASVHTSRSGGDLDWRFVRQGWDVKGYKWPTSLGEPKGPLSSVGTNSNPLQLAMCRAVGILCGAGSYILHNGAGIYGTIKPFAFGTRPANLWETPDIDAIMTAVRGIDALLPSGVENWVRSNDSWGPPNPVHPLRAEKFWEGTSGYGVNKNYAASRQDNAVFVSAPCGIMNEAQVIARNHCSVVISDPLNPKAGTTRELKAGEVLTLQGSANAQHAYIINGTRL